MAQNMIKNLMKWTAIHTVRTLKTILVGEKLLEYFPTGNQVKLTVKRWGLSTEAHPEHPLENGQKVWGLLALNNPDLNRGTTQPVVQLDGLQSSCSSLVLAWVIALIHKDKQMNYCK